MSSQCEDTFSMFEKQKEHQCGWNIRNEEGKVLVDV